MTTKRPAQYHEIYGGRGRRVHTYVNTTVHASDASKVVARNSTVFAYDASHVLAYKGTTVFTFGSPVVELYDNSKVIKVGPGTPSVFVLDAKARDYTAPTPIARRMLTNAMRKTQTA